MTETDTEDFDVVATNPAAFYAGPDEVYADIDLTCAQKLRLLEEWEQDLTRQLESDGEGMAQGIDQPVDGSRENDGALLKKVAGYRRKLTDEKVDTDKPTMVGRVWRRLFSSDKPRAAA
jgi:hypothetical protein